MTIRAHPVRMERIWITDLVEDYWRGVGKDSVLFQFYDYKDFRAKDAMYCDLPSDRVADKALMSRTASNMLEEEWEAECQCERVVVFDATVGKEGDDGHGYVEEAD